MSRSGNVAGVLLLALAAGACAGPNSQPVGQPALGFATEATPVPGKYQAVPTCAQIGQRVPGLPKFRSGNEARSPFSDLHTGCEFQ
ncbi:hypothetical protein, partial [Lentzea sp.]|uniref:hypothetical protein n=1 Tax=Lentzea sp. TaxID=56099 RepID=UPI002ED026B7